MSDDTQHDANEKAAGEIYIPPTGPSRAIVASGETAGMALAAQAKAMVEARYIIAQRQPRDIDVVRSKLLKECSRPSFADGALYSIKRGGKTIQGASIRLAEAAMQAMSNVMVDTITVYDDAEKRIVRVSVIDVEANLSYSLDVNVRKEVERKSLKEGEVPIKARKNSYGDTIYVVEASEGDMLIAQAAAVSKAIRTNGLRLVPGWLIDECLARIRETIEKADKAMDPDAAKHKLMDAFAGIDVSPDMVRLYLGRDAERFTQAELIELRGLYAALRDGEVTWRQVEEALQAHPTAAEQDGRARLRDRLLRNTKQAVGSEAPGSAGGPPQPSSSPQVAPGPTQAPKSPETGSGGPSAPTSEAAKGPGSRR